MPTKRHRTGRHSQVRLALSWSPSSSSLTGAVTVRHKLVCHQQCSYCTPQAGTATNVAATVRHKLVLPPTSQLLYATSWYCDKLALTPIKPCFVFLFCNPNKCPSLLRYLLLKRNINNLFLCVSHCVPVVHLPVTRLRSSGVCHRVGSLAVSCFSGWRGQRSARSCFIPLQKLTVASPLGWALISSPVLQAD